VLALPCTPLRGPLQLFPHQFDHSARTTKKRGEERREEERRGEERRGEERR
jgi:hypothetical protein